MKAVGLTRYLPIDDPESLIDFDAPVPEPGEHDLLVRIEAISVNPIDTKQRAPKPQVEPVPRILGWDAAGIVELVGSGVSRLKPGDAVYYAGDFGRPGCNAQYQCVEDCLVALKPASLDFAQAAALPLTTITAWEALFDRLGLSPDGADAGKTVLIIGAAGGVGSIALQLAQLAGLNVIGTAGRDETRAWVEGLGLRQTIDHGRPLAPQLAALGHPQVDCVLNLNDTDRYWDVIADVLKPQGHACSLVDSKRLLDQSLYKAKSLTHTWEAMFTRARYRTPDMAQQGRILERVAQWFDSGRLRPTLTQTLSPISAACLRQAHALLESGSSIGKLALTGWNTEA